VIRETLRKKKIVIAWVVLPRCKRILMVKPLEEGVLESRSALRQRRAGAYFEGVPDITLSDELIHLATAYEDGKPSTKAKNASNTDPFQAR
jgi:non-homologous end joining protein Ku